MKKFSGAILLVIIVIISFWAGGHFRAGLSKTPDKQGQHTILYYIDPMTPGFRSDKPGIAPCGMPLEPVYADAEEGTSVSMSPGAVKIRTDRQQLIGVKSAAVEPQPMTYNLRLYGKVVTDETRVFRVNASTDSWIRELSDVTTGSFVKKGQLLAEALAPAYYNAQVTYLITLDNMDRIKEQLGGQLRHQQGDMANNQMRVAVQSLQNLGIGDDQVEELANTRKARPYLQMRAPTMGFILDRNISLNQWFKAGEEFYTIADISKVWVYCDVYEDEARYLRPGMTVSVKHAQLGKTFEARVSEVLPLFDPVSKTLKVRLHVDNPQFDLRPDMFVDVEIPITMPPSMHVSADAIIDTGTKAIVYVDMGDGVIEPRQVETGWRLGRRIEVLSGLMPGEKIVVSGNFLIDSESRMKTAAANLPVKVSKDLVCGMDVAEQAAEESGRTVHHEGYTYYFCTLGCKVKFLADLNAYVRTDGAGANSDGSDVATSRIKDPVCGMTVDGLKSEYAGLFVKLHGKPYHFCSRQCMKSFLMDHEKFIGAGAEPNQMSTNEMKQAGTPDKNHGTLVPMTSEQAEPKMSGDGFRWDKPTDGTMRKRSMTPGVVDWDGAEKDKQTKDWSGWGKFPGAEYLGLKDRKTAPASTVGDGKTGGESHTSETAPHHHPVDAREGQANQ